LAEHVYDKEGGLGLRDEFVSSNLRLSPGAGIRCLVRIGKRAWTGAGSVITKDVPPGALAVERAEQRVVRGYDERRRAARERTKNDKDGGPAGTGEGRG
jgi:acetyltransferase-like isoleucine patch superfamily enzyme